ncbi:glutathione S-transferase [Blastocladiella britannica]|nr:glutathione S-transferase [Blastocladiella britannica]
MTTTTPVLYTYWRSSCSWRVRIALNLKGIAAKHTSVNLLKAEHRADDYTDSVNPSKLVPALVIDGVTLTQSLAIIEYLDETRSTGTPILPADPKLRAQVRALAHMIAMDIQPVGNLRVGQHVSQDPAARIAWGKHWVEIGFAALEKALKATAGKYCVGDAVSLADICLVPQVYNAGRVGVDMAPYPTINRICAELEKVDAFARARPEVQRDNPDCVQ